MPFSSKLDSLKKERMIDVDKIMTLKVLRDEVGCFNSNRDWDKFHTLRNLAESIVIEASELMKEFQWDNQFGNPLDTISVKDELADVMIYCISMANRMDIDITDAIIEKMKKNADKYPLPIIACKPSGQSV